MIGRLEVLKYWLLGGGRERATAKEILEVLSRRSSSSYCAHAGSAFIKSLSREGDYTKVVFHHIHHPLYWPVSMDMGGLHLVLTELCNPHHWHYYEKSSTPVSRDDTVIDCGAAEGLFSLSIAGRCKESFAVEPSPEFFGALERTFSDIKDVTIVRKALSDKLGQLYFEECGIGSRVASVPTQTRVDATTIDVEFQQQPRIDYIKADLEGHELSMLKGAVETLQKHRPKLAITTYHDKQDAEEIRLFIKRVVPQYKIKLKGIALNGGAVMLHAWV